MPPSPLHGAVGQGGTVSWVFQKPGLQPGAGVGVTVGMLVGVLVGVFVGVFVGVLVGVLVGVSVGVGVQAETTTTPPVLAFTPTPVSTPEPEIRSVKLQLLVWQPGAVSLMMPPHVSV